eukprot:Gregarina_sp_Poly_1__440@NODE_1107_length_5080_cov_147_992021_g767_i0_p2_GENE_NODE_1107_length_5080_cov_147_992021_g767_i0NODE_1107_length_5080_cov_147_992021_g767_i0_p2_ORF_typecomplete_len410_score41_14zfRING_2/PF13639_6/4_1e07ProkRING_4/PF14447_6/28ProkRING_4/PF14447_6/0_0029zfC3HC4_2/PF13923_6/7_7e05zfC3HC4/PF00097_25/0_00015zfC3HC4_3/PF13920_6/0_00021Rad50_zn_hook/PF04423_14/4_6Rad50_zn_hook/PF04423_14/0_019zfANAPC11/PF12861_7/2_1e03zfANAPC11/PF12861_7/0_0004zfRING_UBOX/PF13445_6/0_002zfRIN
MHRKRQRQPTDGTRRLRRRVVRSDPSEQTPSSDGARVEHATRDKDANKGVSCRNSQRVFQSASDFEEQEPTNENRVLNSDGITERDELHSRLKRNLGSANGTGPVRPVSVGRFPVSPPIRRQRRPLKPTETDPPQSLICRIDSTVQPETSRTITSPRNTRIRSFAQRSWDLSSSETSCIIDEEDIEENQTPSLAVSLDLPIEESNGGSRNATEVPYIDVDREENPPSAVSVSRNKEGESRRSAMDLIRACLEGRSTAGLDEGLDDIDDTEELAECPICMEPFDEGSHCKSQPSECRHCFCISCLLKWSSKMNCCPLCKRRFDAIRKFEADGDTVSIPVSSADIEDSSDSDVSDGFGLFREGFNQLSQSNLPPSICMCVGVQFQPRHFPTTTDENCVNPFYSVLRYLQWR